MAEPPGARPPEPRTRGVQRRRWRWPGSLAAGLLLSLAGGFCLGGGGAARAMAPPQPPAPSLIPLASPEGLGLLLRRATLRADYGPLSQWLETQANLAYCGVASSVVALNSLAVPAPPAAGYGNYRFWTQTNLFMAPAGLRFARPELVARQGMDLEQLQGLVGSQGVVAQRYYGADLSLEQFRLLLRRNLADPRDRLLVNYLRSTLGQPGGGHISPLAAYDPGGDRVLILDVARYRYPAVWVPVADLWRSARTLDHGSGRSRGLVSLMAIPAAAAPPPAENPPPPGPS
ncbi:MAG: phytochelatin synthase family protein [Cyanobium sp.]